MGDIPVSPLAVICVGSSFAFSGLFYHLYRQKKEEIRKWNEIPKFQPNGELVKVVKATPYKQLRYVAIEGEVRPDGSALASQNVPRCFGVIQKIVVSEHWKVWNPITKIWNVKNTNRTETTKVAPFSLVAQESSFDDVLVKVQSPTEATGSYLEQVYRRVRHAREGLVTGMLQELSGEAPVALEETEEVLRVGTVVTCFGEVVLEQGRVLCLQPPRGRQPYLLIATDHRSFMQGHHNSAKMWKLLAATFGLTGVALLVWVLYRAYLKKEEERRKEQGACCLGRTETHPWE